MTFAYLKFISAKCLCLFQMVLVLVLLLWSWSWSCDYVLAFKNLVLFTSLDSRQRLGIEVMVKVIQISRLQWYDHV